jgi:hypothetical protein
MRMNLFPKTPDDQLGLRQRDVPLKGVLGRDRLPMETQVNQLRGLQEREFYSGSPIAVRRRHDVEWLFPQEKATLHITGQCT